MAKKVLIIGATGNFGLEVRRYLLENSGLNYTVLRPGYFTRGAGPYDVTYKGQPVTGYHTAYSSIIEVAVKLMEDHTERSCQSIGINQIEK